MSLQETIWAQSAEALGIPVLLHRAVAAPSLSWSHADYVAQSRDGSGLLAGSITADDRHRGRVLALNFHGIGVDHRDLVTDQLQRLARMGPSALETDGAEELTVLAVFYDGYRDAGLFGAELCHRLGLVALFLPIFEHDEPVRAQLDDADLRAIAAVHRIGYHTTSHRSGAEIVDDAAMAKEVHEPMRRLADAAGAVPRIGAYCGGGRLDLDRRADQELRRLGIGEWLSNWSLETTPPDPSVVGSSRA